MVRVNFKSIEVIIKVPYLPSTASLKRSIYFNILILSYLWNELEQKKDGTEEILKQSQSAGLRQT